MIILRIAVFVLGAAIVLGTVTSAIRTFVVPRGISDGLSRAVFLTMRRLFDFSLRGARSYAARDRVMAFYAPISLLTLPAVWFVLVTIGYSAMFWALGVAPWRVAVTVSGSSLLTLGFATTSIAGTTLLTFSEAAIGLTLLALLIAYLPTMYGAFERREAAVTSLETRAGSPPSAIVMFIRLSRIERLSYISEIWPTWEAWFNDIEESHTSLAALSFYRSPQPDRSWVTAAGAVLDAAALVSSTLDLPRDPRAELCIRAGYLALRRIAGVMRITFDPIPPPNDPTSADRISVSRAEYDAACAELVEAGVRLKADREQAWRDFVGWRVTYDAPLVTLARLTMAPTAPWSSDRLPKMS